MDRLTERNGDSVFILSKVTGWTRSSNWSEPAENAIHRLAAYEDSGLSPEEVQKLKKSDASKEQCTIDQHGEIHRLRDELKRYKQAEQEGRLVVLPCKVGDTVYAIADCADVLKIYDDDYFEGTGAVECPFEKDCPFDECNDDNRRVFATSCKGFWIDDDGRLSMFLDYINADVGPLDFGKTVFLTREEAEKALGVGE